MWRGELPTAVKRRGGLVGDDQLRTADQRPRRGDALLLADAEVGRGVMGQLRRVETKALQETLRLVLRRTVARRPRRTLPREAQGQHDVVEDRAVRQQVEHLKDDAEVLGAEVIAPGIGEPRQIGTQHLEVPRRRRDDAA
jgi:hypothetical protein